MNTQSNCRAKNPRIKSYAQDMPGKSLRKADYARFLYSFALRLGISNARMSNAGFAGVGHTEGNGAETADFRLSPSAFYAGRPFCGDLNFVFTSMNIIGKRLKRGVHSGFVAHALSVLRAAGIETEGISAVSRI